MEIVKHFCLEWYSNKSESDKISKVVESIVHAWNRASLPLRSTSSIRLKVKNLITRFKSIVATRTKSNQTQEKKESDFLEKSKKLFDVVDQDLEITLSEVRNNFLIDQRSNRCLTFFDLDLNEDNLGGDDQNHDSDLSAASVDDDVEMLSEQEYSSESSYDPPSSDDDETPPKKKLKRETIKALDDAGLSFRQMQKVSQAFIKEFDGNHLDYCIASSTFHSNSTRIRNESVQRMTEEMKHRSSKLVLLFDTKTYNQLNSAHLPKEKRIAMIAYSEGLHFGLGINVVENGAADTLSQSLYDASIEFNLTHRTVGLVCDTENANVGYYGGTCAKYEDKVQKQFLQICCRHHIHEIVLKKVCEKVCGKSSTPDFSFEGSNEIKTKWKHMNKQNYRSLDED